LADLPLERLNASHVEEVFSRIAHLNAELERTLHEGGRHTGVSLMHDAEVREDISMREAGHANRDVHQRYTHILEEAHLAAAEQAAALVRRAGEAS
jgi:hypothetical protein